MRYFDSRIEAPIGNRRQQKIIKHSEAIRADRLWETWLKVSAILNYERAMEVVSDRKEIQS